MGREGWLMLLNPIPKMSCRLKLAHAQPSFIYFTLKVNGLTYKINV